MSLGRFAEKTHRRSASRSRSRDRERTKAMPYGDKNQSKTDLVRKKYLASVSHSQERRRDRKDSRGDDKNYKSNKNDAPNMRKESDRISPPSKIFIICFIEN